MATVQIYHHTEGTAALVEYHGRAQDVIYCAPSVTFPTGRRWSDIPLRLVRSTPLGDVRDQLFYAVAGTVALSPGIIRQANSNGLVHVLLPESQFLQAGERLHVVVTTR